MHNILGMDPRFDSFRGSELPSKLQKLIYDRGMTQSRLADLIGVSRQLIYHYVRGSRNIDTDHAIKIANIFNVDVEDVVGTKCIICGQDLKTFSSHVDRLGNSTYKRLKNDEQDPWIYDCHKCGYVHFPYFFLEELNDNMMFTYTEYNMISEVIESVRRDYKLKWYDIMYFDFLSPEFNFVDYSIKIDVNNYIDRNSRQKLTISINFIFPERNKELVDRELKGEDVNEVPDPVPIDYKYHVDKEIIDIEAPTSNRILVYLFPTEKDDTFVAEGYYYPPNKEKNISDELVVLPESIMFKDAPTLKKAAPLKKREEILKKHKDKIKINLLGNAYEFVKEFSFSSPTLAASVLLGKDCRGTILWRNEANISIYELLKKQ